MIERKQFYIDGAWVDPVTPRDHHVINPATEEAIAVISLGGEADAVKAILAARAAFPAFSETSHDERIALLEKIIALYSAKLPEIAHAISQEMGFIKEEHHFWSIHIADFWQLLKQFRQHP